MCTPPSGFGRVPIAVEVAIKFGRADMLLYRTNSELSWAKLPRRRVGLNHQERVFYLHLFTYKNSGLYAAGRRP
jgi:hypothetical protein